MLKLHGTPISNFYCVAKQALQCCRYFSVSLGRHMATKFYDWDALAGVPGLKEWHTRMAQRPLTQSVDQESNAARQAILKQTGRA